MRVLLLSWEYPPCLVGGLGRHVHSLSRHLARRGIQVDVVTRGLPGAPPAEEPEAGLAVFRIAPAGEDSSPFPVQTALLNLHLLEQAVRLIQKRGSPPDLIHAHDWLVAFSARLLKHAYRRPLIATIHATEKGRNSGIATELQRYIHENEWQLTFESWRVICCSRSMQREIREGLAVPPDKIDVIPNGVDPPPRVNPQAVQAYRARYVAPEEKLILYVGRLVFEKGVQVLLDAFPAVLDAFPHCRLVIAGSGGFEGHLRWQAEQKGLSSRVCFTGHLAEEELDLLYRAADVAVFPSLYEPFGLVALEAMVRGTPVVASSVGGLGEIVQHEKNGITVYPGDPASLCWGITRVLGDPELVRRLTRQAKATVRQKYSWDRVAAQTEEVYRLVLSQWQKDPWSSEAAASRELGLEDLLAHLGLERRGIWG
ncbi:MAG: glycosyltransferase family 4 protein [Bacillota bacterium]|nr:glycosyltransferase family 4 protein [Bacillota bacterium]